MTKKHVGFVAGAFAVAAAMMLTGCGGSASSPSAGGDYDLTLALSAGPINLDPSGSANGNASAWYVDLAYQSLINLNENNELEPGLAESWEFIDDDFTQLAVTLRDDVQFADGTDVTADAVVASVEHFAEGTGPTTSSFRNIEVEATDDRTVVFTSAEPNVLLPVMLTPKYMAGAIVSPAGLEDPEAIKSASFGAGPYVLDSARTVAGDTYVYTPNENYYDQDEVKFSEITIRVIPNPTSQVQALKSGQIDVMVGDLSIMPDVEGVENIGVVTNPVFWNGIHLLDRNGTLEPALADVRVRQALNYAVDREAIAEVAYGDYGTAESQPATPGEPSFGYDEELTDYYTYDPAKAKKLLAEAGYADGFELSIPYKGHQPASVLMVQAVAQQLEEVGITVNLDANSNTGEWAGKLATKQFNAAQHDSSGKPRLLELPGYLLAGGPLNQFDVVDPVLVEAFDELKAAGEDVDGTAAKNMTRAMTEQAITIPLVQVDEIILYNSDKVSDITYLGGSPKLSFIYDWSPVEGE